MSMVVDQRLAHMIVVPVEAFGLTDHEYVAAQKAAGLPLATLCHDEMPSDRPPRPEGERMVVCPACARIDSSLSPAQRDELARRNGHEPLPHG